MGNEAADDDGRTDGGDVSRQSPSTDTPSRSVTHGATEPADRSEGSGGSHETSRDPREPTGPSKSSDERATLSLPTFYRKNQLTTAIRGACFWTAIVLPFLYVPLLIAGIESRSEGLALFVLLALNALSLLAGHSYRE